MAVSREENSKSDLPLVKKDSRPKVQQLPIFSCNRIMAMSPDQTADLWLKIDQLHLNYLKSEENTNKLEIRKKLEGDSHRFIYFYIHRYMIIFHM